MAEQEQEQEQRKLQIIGEFDVAKREADPDAEPMGFRFCGEDFKITDKNGSMPLLAFAAAARSGIDADDVEALGVTHDLIKDCIADEDWDRFRTTAQRNKATTPDLMPICRAIWSALSGRPTGLPSGSSDGQSTTGESSKAPSSSEAPSDSTVPAPTPIRSPLWDREDVKALKPVSEAAMELLLENQAAEAAAG